MLRLVEPCGLYHAEPQTGLDKPRRRECDGVLPSSPSIASPRRLVPRPPPHPQHLAPPPPPSPPSAPSRSRSAAGFPRDHGLGYPCERPAPARRFAQTAALRCAAANPAARSVVDRPWHPAGPRRIRRPAAARWAGLLRRTPRHSHGASASPLPCAATPSSG